jgi:hypothetical protein
MNASIHLRFLTLTLLAALSALTSPISTAFAQGDLNPPGAPAPTFKTLQQVEPRLAISVIPTNLTVSGSYYLTDNLTQTADGVAGITISADDITIDLNGFALIGTNGTADGITHGGGIRKNICIKNGTVRNWHNGLDLNGGGYDRVERVRIHGNTENGIRSFVNCSITDCYVADNGFNGILLSANPSLIRDCVIRGNGLDGIQVFGNTVITGNQCTGPSSLASTNAGIRATGNGNRIDGNHIAYYGNGILVSASANLVIRNTTTLTATNFAVIGGNLTGPTNTIGTGPSTNPYANFAY